MQQLLNKQANRKRRTVLHTYLIRISSYRFGRKEISDWVLLQGKSPLESLARNGYVDRLFSEDGVIYTPHSWIPVKNYELGLDLLKQVQQDEDAVKKMDPFLMEYVESKGKDYLVNTPWKEVVAEINTMYGDYSESEIRSYFRNAYDLTVYTLPCHINNGEWRICRSL